MTPKPIQELLAEMESAAQTRHAALIAGLDRLAAETSAALDRHTATLEAALATQQPVTTTLEATPDPLLTTISEGITALLARPTLPEDVTATLTALKDEAQAAGQRHAEASEGRTAQRAALTEISARLEDVLSLRDTVQASVRGTDLTPVLTILRPLAEALGVSVPEAATDDQVGTAPDTTPTNETSEALTPVEGVTPPSGETPNTKQSAEAQQPSGAATTTDSTDTTPARRNRGRGGEQ